jgi:hypothetical protein
MFSARLGPGSGLMAVDNMHHSPFKGGYTIAHEGNPNASLTCYSQTIPKIRQVIKGTFRRCSQGQHKSLTRTQSFTWTAVFHSLCSTCLPSWGKLSPKKSPCWHPTSLTFRCTGKAAGGCSLQQHVRSINTFMQACSSKWINGSLF